MFCSKCGTQITGDAVFCGACGQRVANFAAPPADAVPAPTQASANPAPWGQAPAPEARSAPKLYAGFWLRLVAAIIDALIIGFAFGIPFAFVMAAKGISEAAMNIDPGEPPGAILAALGVGLLFAFFAVFVAGGWLYFALLESSAWQGTIGKKALGLYVTDMDGRKVTFGRASGRYLGGRFLWHVPAFGVLYGFIDCIVAGLSGRKQAVHDMIANCLVLRKI